MVAEFSLKGPDYAFLPCSHLILRVPIYQESFDFMSLQFPSSREALFYSSLYL